ncbi:hypothetical protein Dimus_031855, partial [Dionaea muscipula]
DQRKKPASLISDLGFVGHRRHHRHEHRYPPLLFKRVSADKESSKVQGGRAPSPAAIRPSIPAAATGAFEPPFFRRRSGAAVVSALSSTSCGRRSHAGEVTTTQPRCLPKKRSTSMPKSVSVVRHNTVVIGHRPYRRRQDLGLLPPSEHLASLRD